MCENVNEKAVRGGEKTENREQKTEKTKKLERNEYATKKKKKLFALQIYFRNKSHIARDLAAPSQAASAV